MVPYIPPADVAGGFGRSFSSARQDALADLIARDQVRIRQAQEARAQQQQEWAAAEEAERAKLRPLKLTAEQLALRGQILGPVATPQEYDVARGEVERLGLPTADLPEAEHSTAWQTFQKPAEPAKVGGWLPQQWFPDALPQAPAETAPMPTGPMRGAGITPDDIPAVQRAAERGLPILQQSQMQDKSIGRQLQEAQIAANLEKYKEQGRFRESAEGRAKRAAEIAERKANLEADIAGLNAEIKRSELELSGPGGQALGQAIKELPKGQENAKTALVGVQTIDRMEGLLSEGAGARPGMIKIGLGRLFGYQSDDMAKSEEYQLLAETLRGPLREDIVGPGPMTEAEQRLLGQVTGGGSTGRKAAVALLRMYREKAAQKIGAYNRQVETLSKYDATIPDVYQRIEIPGMRTAPKPNSTSPKVGDTKTFPNGRKAQWDGKGWRAL